MVSEILWLSSLTHHREYHLDLIGLFLSSFFFFFPSTYNACFGRFCGPSTSPMINGDDPRGYKPENFTVPPEWVPLTTNFAVRIHEAKNQGKRDSSDELGTSTKDICSGFNWRILDLLWSEFTY